MFKKDDVVVHEVYGVGNVVGVEELAWKKPEDTLFYVVWIGDAKIWVPVENEKANHLRPITPKLELPTYRKIFQSMPTELDLTRFGRTNYLIESKKHPSFRELCETVRDLTSHGQRKKLANHEVSFLQRVTRQLVEEWALSAQITLEQAQSEIEKLLGDLPQLPIPLADQ